MGLQQPAPVDVQPLVKSLYYAMQSIEGKLGGGEGVEGLYGSIKRTGMQKVLDCLAAQCDLGADSHFVDVGAGLGRPLLHALVHPGVADAFGIEVDAIKCAKAAAFVRQTAAALAAKGASAALLGRATVRCSCVKQVATLEPATHSYSFWEGVPSCARAAFGRLFAASRTLRAVAVVQRAMRGRDPAAVMAGLGFGRLALVAAFPVSMSGSGRSFTAYVFRRVSPSGPLAFPALPAAKDTGLEGLAPTTPSTLRPRARRLSIDSCVGPITAAALHQMPRTCADTGARCATAKEPAAPPQDAPPAPQLASIAEPPGPQAEDGSGLLWEAPKAHSGRYRTRSTTNQQRSAAAQGHPAKQVCDQTDSRSPIGHAAPPTAAQPATSPCKPLVARPARGIRKPPSPQKPAADLIRAGFRSRRPRVGLVSTITCKAHLASRVGCAAQAGPQPAACSAQKVPQASHEPAGMLPGAMARRGWGLRSTRTAAPLP